jgi:hypothetical protein
MLAYMAQSFIALRRLAARLAVTRRRDHVRHSSPGATHE